MSAALFILTNTERVSGIPKSTGFDIREAAHVWHALKSHGYDVTFASVRGGTAHGVLKNDRSPAVRRFVRAFPGHGTVSTNTVRGQLARSYDLLYFVGGLGAMWDFPFDPDVHALIQYALLRGSTIAGICHGQAAFLGLTGREGRPVVEGLALTAFTDIEEQARGLLDKVPFSLEKTLIRDGAIFTSAPDGVGHVVVDGPFITAQNPTSLPELNAALLVAAPLSERTTA